MQHHFLRVTLIGLMALLVSFTVTQPSKVIFPYGKAGLTERQAAAHLISRFTFGAKPQQVDEVVATGLEKWFAQQLEGEWADETVQQKLKKFDALKLTNAHVVALFPRT
ncbi:MAG: DUF1800 family protein, partial [Flammeovirgaceae bacterium]